MCYAWYHADCTAPTPGKKNELLYVDRTGQDLEQSVAQGGLYLSKVWDLSMNGLVSAFYALFPVVEKSV